MRLRLLTLATVVVLAAAACGSDERVAQRPEGIEFEVDAELAVDEGGFTPGRLEVRMGDVVALRNDGDERHRLTSDTIDSGLLQPGDVVTLRFDEPGTIDYHDTEDPSHEGTIVVTPVEP